MIYPHLDLRFVSLLAAIWLILSHGLALLRPAQIMEWARKFPRSRMAGNTLLTIDAIWALALVATMDLGEFSHFRNGLLIVILASSYLTMRYVEEFLAVRALGIFLLLLAEPMIEAAFLRPEPGKLLLVLLAYTLAVLGMFWVGMPYLLRDQIDWVRNSKLKWTAAALAGR
jgi:hypothetical protein